MGPTRQGRSLLVVTLTAMVFAVGCGGDDQESPSTQSEAGRAEFIAEADAICQTTFDAMRNAQRGSVEDFKAGRNRRAGAKVLRGARIFESGIEELDALPRPSADAALLGQWIEGLKSQADRMASVGQAVQASPRRSQELARAQRDWKRQESANQQLVTGFGFQTCV
jgi:hypothetical protein